VTPEKRKNHQNLRPQISLAASCMDWAFQGQFWSILLKSAPIRPMPRKWANLGAEAPELLFGAQQTQTLRANQLSK
jgi:hypothetical protein